VTRSPDAPVPISAPPVPGRAYASQIALPAAHLLALWACVIAQPVFDILRRNGEFFIAHRTHPIDLVVFTAVVSIGVPLFFVVPYAALAAVWPRGGRVVLTGLVGLLATALASQMLAHRMPLPTPAHFAIVGLLGVAAAWAYASRPTVRTFMTMLSPSVVVVPAIFLLHPSMSLFMRSPSRVTDAAAVIDGPAPPIVFLIFDQLPLTSLMDGRGQIDRDRYPGFAALADHSTWYRNASTVAEFTGYAVPPILSSVRPAATRVPTTRSYPYNLFTWLGGRYRLEVQEPITQLCPDWLCAANRAPWPVRLTAMTLDSSVVLLNAVLPVGLRAHLPPLTENWKDFIHAQHWKSRWAEERSADRRRVPRALVDSIGRDDPQPTLYFAHMLLPHEPYVYLRSGQEFTRNPGITGIKPGGHWTTDEWLVTQNYRRHLLQVEYVDTIVGQVIERLKTEGLYDSALIVVTSDHGVSFRPGQPFKELDVSNLPDIMSVPLLIKAPNQRKGVIDDSNIQSVDVMPTLASLLNVPLTWAPQGRAAGPGRIDGTTKTILHGGALVETTVEAAALAQARGVAVARKVALFGEQPGWRSAAVRRGDLIGRRVDDLDVTEGPWQAVVYDSAHVFEVEPGGPLLPALLSGLVSDASGTPVDAELAIAVSGVITAVTRTYRPEDAPRGTWAALADPALFTKGRSDVRVFVLPPGENRLHLAFSSQARPEHLNLASSGAQKFWAVTKSGFYASEGTPISDQWTTGDGALVVPLQLDRPAQSLRVGISGVRPGGTPLTVTFNDCRLFSGRVDAAPWYRTFPLRTCPASALSQAYARILISSPSWVGDGDQRPRGVAVETVNLFIEDWPPQGDTKGDTRGSIGLVNNRQGPRTAGTPVSIVVTNTGTSTWLSAADPPSQRQTVQIALRWRQVRSGRPALEQRMNLPHALYSTDRVLIETPLVPPEALRAAGPWTVTIAPIEQDGTPVPVDAALVLDVTAEHR
jgi:hypothetical protein